MSSHRIVLLPGDGIGPEVVAAARRVLEAVARASGFELELEEAPIGGNAIDDFSTPLPSATLEACERSDAMLLGAVGGDKWSGLPVAQRPEAGLLQLRKRFELFANLRPVTVWPELASSAPLKAELLEGVDMLFVRELTGGLYFGPRQEQGDGEDAFDTMLYSVAEVERVAHVAFQAAARRSGKVTSVDKANVLASMRLWRRTVEQVAQQYPDITLEHLLVDNCAMQLMLRPGDFDVVLAPNLFGDVLSDESAVLAGSLGTLPSASLGEGSRGLYEPVHGSAPDIAGRGIANPIAAIASAALLLRYSLNREAEARGVEAAIAAALADGSRTADLATADEVPVTTEALTDQILGHLKS
ncbi:MAG: 3-isopropylmalate dehydrogenase [Acidobacteriota bacterium]